MFDLPRIASAPQPTIHARKTARCADEERANGCARSCEPRRCCARSFTAAADGRAALALVFPRSERPQSAELNKCSPQTAA
jgi:hypothetical protein